MHRSPEKVLFALALASTTLAGGASDLHDHNANLWWTYAGQHRFAGPWGAHLEAQFRLSDYGSDWQQILLRPGIQYTLDDRISFAAGYAYVHTYPYGDYPAPDDFPEHRVWEQATLRAPFLGLDWVNRLRLEQRFIGNLGIGADGGVGVVDFRYENRIRYLLRTAIPLGASGKTQLVLWDEVFVNFGGEVSGNTFDQNRAFIGIGRALGRGFRLEAGFMEQTIQRRGGRIWEHNHTLAVYLTSTAPFSRGGQ